jgi:hypothetical protein
MRSQIALARGAPGGLVRIGLPSAAKTASKALLNLESRSRSTNHRKRRLSIGGRGLPFLWLGGYYLGDVVIGVVVLGVGMRGSWPGGGRSVCADGAVPAGRWGLRRVRLRLYVDHQAG